MKSYKYTHYKERSNADSEQIQTDSPIMYKSMPRFGHGDIIIDRIGYNTDKYMQKQIDALKHAMDPPQLINILGVPDIEHSQKITENKQAPLILRERKDNEEKALSINSRIKCYSTERNDSKAYILKCGSFANLLPKSSRNLRPFLRTNRKVKYNEDAQVGNPVDNNKSERASPISILNEPLKYSKSCTNFFPAKREWKYSDYSPIKLPFRLGTYNEYKNTINQGQKSQFLNEYVAYNYSQSKVIQGKNSVFPLSQMVDEVILKRYGVHRTVQSTPSICNKNEPTAHHAIVRMNTFMHLNHDKIIPPQSPVRDKTPKEIAHNSKAMNSSPVRNYHFYKLVCSDHAKQPKY